MVLDQITKVNDIKKIEHSQYKELASEIRSFLIDKISANGGHLASNLGVVELTMALHLALDLPGDKIVWDVGHQAYTHKILSGRKKDFNTLRTYGGISGFPKRRESDCDSFDTGHSSTSISAALGIAEGNALNYNDNTVVAVIGDGALSGGMAFEALNNAASLKRNMIIILNDNHMSISENVGAMSTYLSKIRAGSAYNSMKMGVVKTLSSIPNVGERVIRNIKNIKNSIKQIVVPGMLFENMGITYLGPVDGHDVDEMVNIITEAKQLDHPVLIHVMTTKGKGYSYAEKYPSKYHGIEPFDKSTGKKLQTSIKPTYTDVVSSTLLNMGKQHENIVAITAAMADGTGLSRFMKAFPERCFDVGIAEEHAVTFAAGLATTGKKPYVAIYSSFLQRAYDQILHDVCIQDLPVTFLVDRAGLISGDGETHQGIFDLSYLSNIPNMYIIAPKNKYELYDAMHFSFEFEHPLAIRYPRGEAYDGLRDFRQPFCLGESEVIYKENEICLLPVGKFVKNACTVRGKLKAMGYHVSLVNARFVKPIDETLIEKLTRSHRLLVTLEENVLNGGYGECVVRYVNSLDADCKVFPIAVPNVYVEHGSLDELYKETGLDVEQVVTDIVNEIERLKEENR